MPKEINNSDEYKEIFKSEAIRKRALKCALDIRKFEIDLYWKRTTYFWTLIAAAFAGYFLLKSKPGGGEQRYVFLVCCIGTVLSVSWYLANRGSKYWQENWERHVDTLEEEFMGPLYKTIINRKKYSVFAFWKGYPYSVSRINQITSIFIMFIWIGMSIDACPLVDTRTGCWSLGEDWILTIITILTVVVLFVYGRTGRQDKKRPAEFFKTDSE